MRSDGSYKWDVVSSARRGGFAIPLRNDGAGRAFDLSLAPGERTVIELRQ